MAPALRSSFSTTGGDCSASSARNSFDSLNCGTANVDCSTAGGTTAMIDSAALDDVTDDDEERRATARTGVEQARHVVDGACVAQRGVARLAADKHCANKRVEKGSCRAQVDAPIAGMALIVSV